jgi:hypothetical protein
MGKSEVVSRVCGAAVGQSESPLKSLLHFTLQSVGGVVVRCYGVGSV